MKICVCGWYLKRYTKFYEDLLVAHASGKHEVRVVSNKMDISFLSGTGLPFVVRANVGLDGGAYRDYLDRFWDRESSVFFTHDDVVIKDVLVFDEIAEKTKGLDHAYIFRDEVEAKNNGRKHGRAMWVSARLLKAMMEFKCCCQKVGPQPHSGFWFDEKNTGYTGIGPNPLGVDYNNGINHLHYIFDQARRGKLVEKIQMKALVNLHIVGYVNGRRGVLKTHPGGGKGIV